MRQTAKFKAAHALINQLYKGDPKRLRSFLTMDHETLYEALHEDMGYMWDNQQGKWYELTDEEREFTGSLASMFVDRDGKPSGIYRLRIMCHPDEANDIIAMLRKKLTVGEISNPYPNRKGEGVRFYATAKHTSTTRKKKD